MDEFAEGVARGVGKCIGSVLDVVVDAIDLAVDVFDTNDNKQASSTNASPVVDRVTPRDEEARQKEAIRLWLAKPEFVGEPCGCLGPRDEQPACPCAMAARFVVVDGYYYEVKQIRKEYSIVKQIRKEYSIELEAVNHGLVKKVPV